MLKKRLLSGLLVFSFLLPILALPVSAIATEPQTAEEQIIDSQYNSYTISLPTLSSETNSTASLQTESESEHQRHLQNISAAKNFVYSLDLPSQGYSSVEDACIGHLERMEDFTEGILSEYTVLVPKASVPYSYFGTYQGRDFYYSYYDSYTIELKRTNTTVGDKAEHWATAALDFLIGFLDYKISIPYAIFRTMMSAPPNYTVKTSSYIESYVNLQANCRGIYTLNNSGYYIADRTDYVMVLSDEAGIIAPFAIFHPVDVNYSGAYTHNCPRKSVAISTYYNTQSTLIMANANYKPGGSTIYLQLKYVVPTYAWGKL